MANVTAERVLRLACERLAVLDADAVYGMASGLGLALATPDGSRQLFADAFGDAPALAQAFAQATPAAKECSLVVLAHLDADAALPLFLEGLELGSTDPTLGRAVSHAYRKLANQVPAERLVALCEAGKIRPEGLTPEAWSLIEPTRVYDWVANGRVVVEYLPEQAWARLDGETLVTFWLEGKLPYSRLPARGREALDAEAIGRAWSLGVKVTGIPDAVRAVTEGRPAEETQRLLEHLLSLSGALDRTGRPSQQALFPYELDSLGHLANRLSREPRSLPGLRSAMRLDSRLFSRIAETLVRGGEAWALEAMGEIIDEVLAGDDPLHTWPLRWPIAAVVAIDPATATERLRDRFSPEALSDPRRRQLASMILSSPIADFTTDRRWAKLAADLIRIPALRDPTRALLARVDAKTVRAALKAANYEAPRAAALSEPALPAKRDFLRRYQSGEHREVWQEICDLQDSVRHPDVAEEIFAVAREMMQRVRSNLERIANLLKKKKYALVAKTPKRALPAPAKTVEKDIAAMEKLLGAPLPIALAAFYQVVGSVDLTEAPAGPSSPLLGFGTLDPMMVIPPKLARQLLKDEAAHEKQFPKMLRRPLDRIPIALSPGRKADDDAENDEPYELLLCGQGADGELRQGDHATSFVGYLRTCIARGGFYAAGGDEAARTWLQANIEPF